MDVGAASTCGAITGVGCEAFAETGAGGSEGALGGAMRPNTRVNSLGPLIPPGITGPLGGGIIGGGAAYGGATGGGICGTGAGACQLGAGGVAESGADDGADG